MCERTPDPLQKRTFRQVYPPKIEVLDTDGRKAGICGTFCGRRLLVLNPDVAAQHLMNCDLLSENWTV